MLRLDNWLLVLCLFSVGCSSSSDNAAILDDTISDEVAQETQEAQEAQEAQRAESLPNQPINVSQSYFRAQSFVSWNAPINGPEAIGYKIKINGEFIQNPEILEFESLVTRFSHPVQAPSIGKNIVEVFSFNDAGDSEASVQWVFNDLGRPTRTTNLGVIGEPIERQFFIFPLRKITTIDTSNYVPLASLLMNALQVQPVINTENRNNIDAPVQDMIDSVATTQVFLCENEGRRGFYEWRAGGLNTDFDYDAYGDCLLNDKVINGWLNQRVFQSAPDNPEVVLDEIFSLDLSNLAMTASELISGQLTISAFNDESVSIIATIEESFAPNFDGFWDSGVMSAVASDGSTLKIDATTNDSRTVNYTLLNDGITIIGTLPWPTSDLPSPPANIRRDNSFRSDDFILWAGATDDSVGQLVFEIFLDGNRVETVTEDFRDFSPRRSVFESGYYRYPSIENAVDKIQSGTYSIITVDPDGNRSEPATFFVD